MLPQQTLQRIMRLDNITCPMMFKITNHEAGLSTHAGVIEFSADDGCVLLPDWMREQIKVSDVSDVSVEYVQLPTASYAKLQPQTANFFDVSDHRAVLEEFFFQNFSCLTVGDEFVVHRDDEEYPIKVVELEPEDAASIIDCDLNVDVVRLEGEDGGDEEDESEKEDESEEDAQSV